MVASTSAVSAAPGTYFDAYLQGTRLLMLSEQIRYLEPDTVTLVRTGCVLWGTETACTDEALSVNTNVLVKRHGRWLQTSFQIPGSGPFRSRKIRRSPGSQSSGRRQDWGL